MLYKRDRFDARFNKAAALLKTAPSCSSDDIYLFRRRPHTNPLASLNGVSCPRRRRPTSAASRAAIPISVSSIAAICNGDR